MSKSGAAVLAIFSGALIDASFGPAGAAIRCMDGYQMIQGNPLATPYCQDELLAKVAREYGMKAQAAVVRNNPNYKREVCRFVGHDIRVQNTCIDAYPSGRGRR